MNVLAAGIAFVVCTMFGFMSAYRLQNRTRGIHAIIADIKRVQSRMEYSSASIGRILSEMDTSPICKLWSCMGKELSEGACVLDGWRSSYEHVRSELPLVCALHAEDTAALEELFSELGRSDIESQRQYFALFYSRMEAIYQTAENDYKNRGRVFRGIGALGGVAVAILLI